MIAMSASNNQQPGNLHLTTGSTSYQRNQHLSFCTQTLPPPALNHKIRFTQGNAMLMGALSLKSFNAPSMIHLLPCTSCPKPRPGQPLIQSIGTLMKGPLNGKPENNNVLWPNWCMAWQTPRDKIICSMAPPHYAPCAIRRRKHFPMYSAVETLEPQLSGTNLYAISINLYKI